MAAQRLHTDQEDSESCGNGGDTSEFIGEAHTVKYQFVQEIVSLPLDERIAAINELRAAIHEISPFKDEPVDYVAWVKTDDVQANDYNPNSVAPPEMELLATSILADGYTQPIVTWPRDDIREVVDGFHRNRVARENKEVNARIHGYLPVVSIKATQTDKGDRIASTIRHNRARGKHRVEAMADIVVELKKRNWSNARIAKELGMDDDEVLRLCQITGLTELFADATFSQAWDAVIMKDEEVQQISEEDFESEIVSNGRIFHEWNKWECYPAGFYSDKPPEGMTVEQCEESYRDFLADLPRFEAALSRVLNEWPNSCEHYLTNDRMNRIAWLGQSSMCIETGIPSRFCGGYNLLSDDAKLAADTMALKYLNVWLEKNGRETINGIEAAQSRTEANLY